MSDAVDNAEVMLSCISLAYKESASTDSPLVLKPAIESCAHTSAVGTHACCLHAADCRLELQYAHQQDVVMIPLVCDCSCLPLPAAVLSRLLVSLLSISTGVYAC